MSWRVVRFDQTENGEEKNEAEHQDLPSGIVSLLSDRRVLIFCIAVVLFHFANAAMLPLVGQRLSEAKQRGQRFICPPASLWLSWS